MSHRDLPERWENYHSIAMGKGLKAALAELSIEKSFDEFEDGHIKLNKLLYVAMAECGLYDEMQHSWHRYGGDLGTLVPSTHSVRPTALNELPVTEEPPAPTGSLYDREIWDKNDYCNFFKSVSIGSLESLEEILEANRQTLLNEFYSEYSGDVDDWVELYLINVRIQEFLALHDSDTVCDFDIEDYESLVDTISAFRSELFNHKELSPSELERYQITELKEGNPAELLSEFLDLIDDVFFTIAKRDPDTLRGTVSYPLTKVEEFYHERAWNLVTKIISLNTTRGPNEEAIVHGSIEDIKDILRGYLIRFERVESECRAANLLPEETGNDASEESMKEGRPGDLLPTSEEFRIDLRTKER